MSNRIRVEDEVQRAQALRAAAERTDEPAPSIADAPEQVRQPGRGGVPAVARAIGGLQAGAGNGAVAWLLGGSASHHRHAPAPSVHAASAIVGEQPAVQTWPWDDDEEAAAAGTPATNEMAGGSPDPGGTAGDASGGTTGAGGDNGAAEATPLGGGAPAGGPSWTKIGPPSNSSYSVSGSLRTVANAVAARTEAGSVTTTPSMDTDTWTPDGSSTAEVISARVTVAQAMELPDWSDKSSATKGQQAEWDRFKGAITTHENGHVGKDKTAFASAHTKMTKLSSTDADTKLDEIDKQAKKDNTDYDTATDHGKNQGTGINANIDEVTKVP